MIKYATEVGMSDLAEDELHVLLKADNRAELAPAVMIVARQAGLPSLLIAQECSSPKARATAFTRPVTRTGVLL